MYVLACNPRPRARELCTRSQRDVKYPVCVDYGTVLISLRWQLTRGLVALGLTIVALGAASCRSSSASHEIVAIPLFSATSVSLCEHLGLDEAVVGSGLHLEFNGPSDGDAQRQIDLFRDAVDRRVYGITMIPGSQYAANSVIHDALAHSIPVVIVLHALPLAPQPHLSFVLENLPVAARLIAERVRSIEPGGADIILVGLDSLTAGGQASFIQVERALHEVSPESRVVTRIVKRPNAHDFSTAIEETLDQQPGAHVIITLDDLSSYSAAAVIHSRHAADTIHLIAFDQNAEVLSALRQGEVDSVVAQNMREMGHIAIANIMHDHAHEQVASETLVSPVLVTRENIDTEAVQRLLMMNWVQP
jgi:ABC-type sugar transport system substrate-binding protein